jgi:hypothetical protein
MFFSELFVLREMVHRAQWLPLLVFLVMLMVIFIGMSRSVLRMLQTPGEALQPAGQSSEGLNLSHALGLYAMAISVPLALFQPAALFDSLRTIVSGLGFQQ